MRREFFPSGFDRLPKYSHKDREHYWTVAAMWFVEPARYVNANASPDTTALINLEHDALVFLKGPGCLHCNQEWTPKLALQPCDGRPR
jgi:hypothetical protein